MSVTVAKLILVDEHKLFDLLVGVVGDNFLLDDIIEELSMTPPVTVEWLAGVIRRVDGDHTKGAAALAEAILAEVGR